MTTTAEVATHPRCSSPCSSGKDGWSKLAKNLKAEVDEDMMEAYRGAEFLPFEFGENKRIAVKIVDGRGVESLRVMELNDPVLKRAMTK